MITVILADDHRIFADGISALCQEAHGIRLAGTAASGGEALTLIERERPQVAIVDITMPGLNGIQTTRSICERFPATNVLILSMSNEFTWITQAFEAGAIGYIVKNAGKEEFLLAIRQVAAGKKYYSAEVAETLIAGQHGGHQLDVELSSRELEVLRLICNGHTAPEVAEQLFISEHTVKTHRKNLLGKTGCRNSLELVKFALENHLL